MRLRPLQRRRGPGSTPTREAPSARSSPRPRVHTHPPPIVDPLPPPPLDVQDVFEDDIAVHLVMELCEGGSVLDGLKDGEYSERQVRAAGGGQWGAT